MIAHKPLAAVLRATAWLSYGRKYETPVRPDRLVWVEPDEIVHKPTQSPGDRQVPPPVVVGGDWDQELEPITEDIVFETFHRRFVEGRPWKETGYVDFLKGGVSEHGGLSRADALDRCEKLDRLYEYIERKGYKMQSQLEREGGLIEELTPQLRPPVYREITVDITRDGELVWHGGMHRLIISKLLDIHQIPVRINTRHEKWQTKRERIYTTGGLKRYYDHPDIKYLIK